MPKERKFGLDLLRAFAILIVVYGHSGIVAPNFVEKFPNIPLPGGVDIFFVLSGFLIGKILISLSINQKLNNFHDLKRFWSRRWWRTLPLYFFILLINIILTKMKLIPSDIESVSFHFFIFSQNLFSGFVGFFYESWSLSVEEWFYIILPLIIFGLIKTLELKKAILISVMLIILIPLAYRILCFNPEIDSFHYNTGFKKVVLCRLDAIGFGVLAAYIFIFKRNFWDKYKFVTLFIGLFIITFSMFRRPSYNSFEAQSYFLSILPFGVMFTLPYFNAIKDCSIKWLKSIITYISLISYSLYLTNLSIVALLLEQQLPETTKFSGIRNYILYWLITFLVSSLTYYIIEKPFLKLRKTSKLTEGKIFL